MLRRIQFHVLEIQKRRNPAALKLKNLSQIAPRHMGLLGKDRTLGMLTSFRSGKPHLACSPTMGWDGMGPKVMRVWGMTRGVLVRANGKAEVEHGGIRDNKQHLSEIKQTRGGSISFYM
jgi:hypothetical protein